MAEMMRGMGGLGKTGSMMEKKPKPMADPAKMDKGKVEGEAGDGGGVKIHELHEHPDGHMETKMAGEDAPTEHPDHLAALTHMAHAVTGGDKHLMMHHDGMSAHSHMVDEAGQHEDHGEHNSAEEAKQSLDKFFGEEAQEPQHQGEMGEEESAPAYGGM